MKKLKTVLLINAISSGFTGLLLIILAKTVASIFGVTETSPFIAVGVFLVLFALYVYSVSKKQPAMEKAVRLVIVLDTAWVLTSAVTIVLLQSAITFIGIVIIVAIALWVAGMAYLQNKGLQTGKTNVGKIVALLIIIAAFSNSSVTAQTTSLTNDDTNALTVVNSFLNAVKEKSHAKAVPLMDSLIQWNQPGNNRFSGVKKNAKEVFAMFTGFLKLTERTLQLTEVKVLAVNGNSVACLLHWEGFQPGGLSLSVDNIDVYTVVNGKIKNVVIYSADNKKEDDFWGK